MFRTGKVVCAITLIFIGWIRPIQEGYYYVVLGKTVNQEGKPVPFAYVAVTSSPNDEGGDPIYAGSADADGNIRFEIDESNLVRPTRLLFVTGAIPAHAVAPVKPPFNDCHSLTGPQYTGHLITIKKNGEVNVGNALVSLYYGAIKVLLQDQTRAPLVKNATSWEYVWLRIRNNRNQKVIETSLSEQEIEETVDLAKSSMVVALPEGEWYIDVSLHEDKGPWLAAQQPVRVEASNQPTLLILKQQ